MSAGRRAGWPLALPGVLLLGFLVAPFLGLLGSLPGADRSSLPSAAPALGTSLAAATLATALDGLLGIPLGYLLSGPRSTWKRLAVAAVALPLAVPPVVGGLELILLLGRAAPLGSLLDRFGLNPLDTLAGTVIAQAFVAAPFVVISARAAFDGVDPALRDAARVLGCGPVQAFLRAVLPAARLGVLAGLLLGWLRCLGEFGATAVLAYHPYTLPTLTYVDLTGAGLPAALPAGALLALTGAAVAAGMLWLESRGGAARQAAGGSSQPVRPARGPRLAWIAGAARPGRISVRAVSELAGFRLDVLLEQPATALVLLGPSGAGKSLTLRTLAGLFEPAVGEVRLGERLLLDTGSGLSIPPERRGLGYLAQRDGLFPHLDVAANVAFGLRGLPAAEREGRVLELLDAVGLARRSRARPATLSGGERQRAGLARALAGSPSLLLLDEPFSSLDTATRRELRVLVRELHERTGVPLVLVSHDREDALELADRVAILEAGRVTQQGALVEVFSRPRTAVAAQLVGVESLISVRELGPASGDLVSVLTPWGRLQVPAPDVSAEHWSLAVPSAAVSASRDGVEASVAGARWAGGPWRVRAEAGGEVVEALVDAALRPEPGTLIRLSIDGSRTQLLAELDTGADGPAGWGDGEASERADGTRP